MSNGSFTIPNPFDYPEEWDTVYFGGVPTPGVAEISDVKRANVWDVKRGKGARGATITYTGDEPAKFTVKLKLWTRDHFEAWERFQPLLKFDPSKKTIQAVDVYHPALAHIEITSVVTSTIGGIVHEGGGLYSVEIELLEFRTPITASVGTPNTSKAGATSSGAGGGGKTGDQPDPIAEAQQKEIASLIKQAQQP